LEGGSIAHSNPEFEPWWQVDLEGTYEIEKVIIYNRQDLGRTDRLQGVLVEIFFDGSVVWSTSPAISVNPDPVVVVSNVSPNVQGDSVKLSFPGKTGYVNIAEVQVMAHPVFQSVSNNPSHCDAFTSITHLSNNVIELLHTYAHGWGCGACGNQRITGISFTNPYLITISLGLNRFACADGSWRQDHSIAIEGGRVCAHDLNINGKYGLNCRTASSTDTFRLEVRDNKVFYYHNGVVFYDTTSPAGTIYHFDYAVNSLNGNSNAKVTVELFG
jgi:hypothetical protein